MANRIDIPPKIAAQVLFDSEHTCCICQEPGKAVQIHHIDGDSSNSLDLANLAVVCFEDHDKTMVRGGFGRKLDADQVKLYKIDWERRVKKRRESTDALMVQARAGQRDDLPEQTKRDEIPRRTRIPDQRRLLNYIRSLPGVKRDAYNRARPLWNQDNMASQRGGAADVNDIYVQILLTLCSYYPPGHFSNVSVQDYLSELIASRYRWHRARWEPLGAGTGGTIIRVLVAGDVMADLESMISEVASNLLRQCGPTESVDFESWSKEWKHAGDEDNG